MNNRSFDRFVKNGTEGGGGGGGCDECARVNVGGASASRSGLPGYPNMYIYLVIGVSIFVGVNILYEQSDNLGHNECAGWFSFRLLMVMARRWSVVARVNLFK